MTNHYRIYKDGWPACICGWHSDELGDDIPKGDAIIAADAHVAFPELT